MWKVQCFFCIVLFFSIEKMVFVKSIYLLIKVFTLIEYRDKLGFEDSPFPK